jgi:hypothetical protein
LGLSSPLHYLSANSVIWGKITTIGPIVALTRSHSYPSPFSCASYVFFQHLLPTWSLRNPSSLYQGPYPVSSFAFPQGDILIPACWPSFSLLTLIFSPHQRASSHSQPPGFHTTRHLPIILINFIKLLDSLRESTPLYTTSIDQEYSAIPAQFPRASLIRKAHSFSVRGQTTKISKRTCASY